MSTRLAQVVRKREALVARCGAQRDALGMQVDGLRRVARVGDTAMRVGRALRRHPVLTAAAALIVLPGLVRRHRLLVWAGRAFTFWELYRTFRAHGARARSG